MYVITGGAGFLGSALVWRLNELGIEDIVIVDNLSKSQKWRNLVSRSYVDYIPRDKFLEMIKSGQLPFNLDGMVHFGACSSTTETDCDFLMANNFYYSRHLCRFALERGCRFVHASSAATYGAGEYGFSDDLANIKKLSPLNMYGYSKHLFDLWLLRENIAGYVASLKFFNVYGPNEYHKGSMSSVAYKIFHEIERTGKASLFASTSPDYADGGQKRDFVYVKDVVNLAAWLLLEKKDLGGIYNVGSGHAASFNELARAMFKAMDRPEKIEYIPMPQNIARNYQNFTEADMSWLAKTNYAQKFSNIEDGIHDYAQNYLAKNDACL